ncbi:MAG TPA: DUF4097 family beta strand repeat-containing protein [Bryobacteraceae bacterium]|nr:DUF4097 family beta strand repeat-containing protein [Bryobacteraceae bacterium]
MRCSWASAAMAVAGSLVLCASSAELRREGRYWIAQKQGAASTQGIRTVRVDTRGRVSVRGSNTNTVAWTAVIRVETADERQARALLAAAVMDLHRVGETMSLSFASAAGQPDAELSVVVPRETQVCWIRTLGGTVQAWDLDGALEVSSAAGSLQLDRIRGPVKVRTGGGEVRIGRVDGEVYSFTGAGGIRADYIGGRARLDTAGGEILVKYVHGPLLTSSAGGSIEVQQADSSITARTNGGVIEVGRAAGPVTADTGGGAIQISGSSGAECQASEGPIRLKNVAGAVRAVSGSGDIIAQLMPGRPLQNSKLSTNSGDITVVIPATSSLTIVAQSARRGAVGRIISDFPEIRLASRRGTGGALEMAEGSLNGGGPVLQVVASGGSVYLRRQRQQ